MIRYEIRVILLLILLGLSSLMVAPLALARGASPVPPPSEPGRESQVAAEHVILFVLEGIGQDSLKAGPMPVLSRLVKGGAVTWSAQTVSPPHRLPAMASLFTGLPVERHHITWNAFEFSRGYPRPPMLFDYLDLSGGKDSAIFFMDESLLQLARPASYIDYQVCGRLRTECRASTIVRYVQDYLRKGKVGGYGHYVYTLPHVLVVHLPDAGFAEEAEGPNSGAYRAGLQEVDRAMGAILDQYKELGLLARTAVFVTSLSGPGATTRVAANGESMTVASRVPWIASGAGIKAGHVIQQPVSILDTGATVMRTFGLTTHTDWESRVVGEIFRDGAVTPSRQRKER